MTQERTHKHNFTIPPVGHRTLKSAVSILLCYAVYMLRGHQGLVFYSMLAALWCIRPYFDNTVEMALQRVSGTLIGAVYGLIVLLLDAYLLDVYIADTEVRVYELLYCLIVAAAIVPIIETTLILKHKDASYFSCVVFLSIVVNHVGDDNPYIFVLNRVVDTLIGVAIGIGINTLRPPVRKRDDILFVSGVDDTLIAQDEMLSDYSRRQFNYLIDRGANFTISTMRAPATVQKILSGVHLKLPIIAMDGAVLYDMENNVYIREFVISAETADEVRKLAEDQGLNCFTNIIIDDCLLTYYDELNNEAQKDMYHRMRKSPLRNYLQRTPPEKTQVVYFLLLDESARMQKFYDLLCEKGYDERLKISFYPAKNYPGYHYVKIYNKNASRENMLTYLKEITGLSETVTFGSEEGKYDVTVSGGDTSQVARTLKQMYEEPIWRRQNSSKHNK